MSTSALFYHIGEKKTWNLTSTYIFKPLEKKKLKGLRNTLLEYREMMNGLRVDHCTLKTLKRLISTTKNTVQTWEPANLSFRRIRRSLMEAVHDMFHVVRSPFSICALKHRALLNENTHTYSTVIFISCGSNSFGR